MTRDRTGPHNLLAALAGCLAAMALTLSAPAYADDNQPPRSSSNPHCDAPSEFTRINAGLPRTAHRIAAGEPLTIVAVGSSSTAGAGASSPAHSYPGRLAAELKERYPALPSIVVNRGANGEDATEMLARFEQSVLSENPDLVLWQVGTNSLLLDRPLDEAGALIVQGLDQLKRRNIDVVLIDSQYAPKVLAKPHLGKLRDLMSTIAKRANVPTFQRFEVMRFWRETAAIPFQVFLSPDELHMNDWSYGCIAKLLANAITEAAERSALTAQAGAPR
jgi:acyl-CoA thioesterase I